MGASLIFLFRSAKPRPHFFAPPDERWTLFLSGKAPPITRLHLLTSSNQSGFCHTLGRNWIEKAKHDPFYNEFLLPNEMTQRYATPVLKNSAGPLVLNIIRDPRLRPYDEAELTAFEAVIPHLQIAALMANEVALLRANAQAAPFEQRGEAVFRLNFDGAVIGRNAEAEEALRGPLRLVNGRLTATYPLDQKRVEHAILRAIRDLHPVIERIGDGQGSSRYLLLAIPVAGDARDIFVSASAIVVLIDTGRRIGLNQALVGGLRAGFGATQREAEVAALVSTGLNVETVSERLRIGQGTARNHLKSVMQKMDVRSQTELAALVARLS